MPKSPFAGGDTPALSAQPDRRRVAQHLLYESSARHWAARKSKAPLGASPPHDVDASDVAERLDDIVVGVHGVRGHPVLHLVLLDREVNVVRLLAARGITLLDLDAKNSVAAAMKTPVENATWSRFGLEEPSDPAHRRTITCAVGAPIPTSSSMPLSRESAVRSGGSRDWSADRVRPA